MITVEQAKELAKEEAVKNGFDFADFVTQDEKLGYVFHFMRNNDLSEFPKPTGLPVLFGLKNGVFSSINGFKLIFKLLDKKSS